MNKSELVDALADRLGGNKKQAGEALEVVIDTIYRAVAKGEKVTVTGFGSFEKVERAARTGRNPATGETIKVKKSVAPRFRAGQEFKNVVSGKKKLGRLAKTTAPATKTAATARPAAAKKAAAPAAKTAAPAKKAPAKKAPATRATATTAPAARTTKAAASKAAASKAAPATRTAVKSAPATKAVAKKAPATKTTAARAASKAPATKAVAKKAPAKRAAKKS